PLRRHTSRIFYFKASRHTRTLHSFPTRRSSDLTEMMAGLDMKNTPWITILEENLEKPLNEKTGDEKMIAALKRHLNRQSELKAGDRKSTRLNSSHVSISYAVFCLKKKTIPTTHT